MDSKQTPQQRIEQDGKVYEFTGETRLPTIGEFFLDGLSVRKAPVRFRCITYPIYREVPAEPPQASEEARPTATITRDELLSHLNRCTEIVSQWPQWQQELIGKSASRDEELRRLREENERLNKAYGVLVCDGCGRLYADDRDALDESCGECGRFKQRMEWTTAQQIEDADAVHRGTIQQQQEQIEKLTTPLATLERHYSEARGLVEHDEPHFAPVLARHDQERAACKPCGEPREHETPAMVSVSATDRDQMVRIAYDVPNGRSATLTCEMWMNLFDAYIRDCERIQEVFGSEPLPHSEADKICAGEPVRQGEDLAAQVEKLQAENKLLREQRKLAYNWLTTRDKEMFNQKYPKEVTV